jgi:cytochrome d ubiquinol oxidase subunit II
MVGLLDWYTISVAIFAVVMLATHGANYLTLKTEGPVHERSTSYAKWLWAAVGPLIVIISLQTWFVHPELPLHGIQ